MKIKAKKAPVSSGRILYWAVCVLLVCTMLSLWIVSGLFAKYVIADSESDAARIAKSGILDFDLLEHKVREKDIEEIEQEGGDNTFYDFLPDEIDPRTGVSYLVLPGVDIPKDPFVRLKLKNAELAYELYVTITEGNVPKYSDGGTQKKAIEYSVTDDWDYVESASKPEEGFYVYRYNKTIDPTFAKDIPILKDNIVKVSEHYDADAASKAGQSFTLVFDAYLKQATPA